MRKAILWIVLIAATGCGDGRSKNKAAVPEPAPIIQPIISRDTASGDIPETSQAEDLDTALAYARQHKDQAAFKHTFTTLSPDGRQDYTHEERFGHLFTKLKKHLLIKRVGYDDTFTDLFLLESGTFKQVNHTHTEFASYLEYQLRDVNGDGFKDFLIHSYPASGCCRRDIYEVNLYLPQTGGFSKPFRFINPTFSPHEKIIRGVEYGQPGEVGLYKFRWKGLSVKTVEFIYQVKGQRGKYLKTWSEYYPDSTQPAALLNRLPKEYQKIESIEWFIGF